jgi:hypothetical protein
VSRNLVDWRALTVSSFAVGFAYPGDLAAFALALMAAKAPWVQSRERNDRFGEYLVLRPQRDAVGVIRIVPRDGGFIANASLRRMPGDAGQAITEASLAALVSRAGALAVRSVATLESELENPRLEAMRLAVYRTRSAGSGTGMLPLGFTGTASELAARVRTISTWTWKEHATYVSASVLPAPHAGYVQLVCAEASRAAWYFEAVSTSDTPCAPARGKAMVDDAKREVLALIEQLQ